MALVFDLFQYTTQKKAEKVSSHQQTWLQYGIMRVQHSSRTLPTHLAEVLVALSAVGSTAYPVGREDTQNGHLR